MNFESAIKSTNNKTSSQLNDQNRFTEEDLGNEVLKADEFSNVGREKLFTVSNNRSKSFNFSSLLVHPKFTLNTPGDEHEQEADAMADKIMHISAITSAAATNQPVNTVQTKPEISGNEEPEEEKKERGEENEPPGRSIQKKLAASDEEEKNILRKNGGGKNLPVVSRNVHQVIQSPGQPLDQSTRSFMESRFGCDFGKVQIHDNALAHQSAKDINALAYTHQHHIAFGTGQYQPQTESGKWLLAHELTHVLQQPGGDVIKRAADINNLNTDMSGEDDTGMSLEEENSTSTEGAKFIVEDGNRPGDGQMLKSQFLNALNEEICRTVEAGLAGTEYTADNCPYIKAAFARHKSDTPLFIEELIERYSGAVSRAKDVYDLISLMQERVSTAVAAWVKNKDLSAVPAGIRNEIYKSMTDGLKDELKKKARELAGPLLKTKNGEASATKPDREIAGELGEGKPIESRTKNKMENALDDDFSDVEIHTDARATAVSESMNARAFATGKHIVFNENQYRPGTLAGDALLAHELAHVQQQKDDSIAEALSNNDHSIYNQLENEADEKAVGALSKLWKNSKKLLNKFPKGVRRGIRGGLQIQRCWGEVDPYRKDIGDPYYTEFTWGGEEFTIDFSQYLITDPPHGHHLYITIRHTGVGQNDGATVPFYHDFTLGIDPGVPDPVVDTTADGNLKVDMYNDGTFIFIIRDSIILNNSWKPPLQEHVFEIDINGKKQVYPSPIRVKPIDSVPAPAGSVPDSLLDQPVKTASIQDPVGSIQVAQLRLEEVISKNIFRKSLKAGLVYLQKQLSDDITAIKAKGSGLTKAERDSYITKANDLDDSLRNDGAVLENLSVIATEGMYLEDIANEAIAFVDEVRNEFEQALLHAYVSNADMHAFRKKGTELLLKLPYKISSLYIVQGKGIEAVANKIGTLKLSIEMYRGMSGRAVYARDLDMYLDQLNPKKKIEQLTVKLRRKFFDNAEDVLSNMLTLTIDSKRYLAVYSIMALYDQFYFFEKEIPWVTSSSSTRTKVTDIRDKLKLQLDAIEPTLSPTGTQASFEKVMETAMQEYVRIVSDKDFETLIQTIQEDFKDWEKIKFVGKAIVIIAAAAFTAGEAGLAMGAALKTAGIGGAVAFGAVAFSEALAFTATSRLVGSALFGIQPTESFGSELITNWLMFGYLKKFEQMYKMMTIAMELRGMSKAVGIASKGLTKGAFTLGALQLFSWVHETAKGKSMTAGEFAESTVFNAVIMAVLHVGKYMHTPTESRFEAGIRAEINKSYAAEFAELEKARANLKTIMDDMAKGKVTDPAKTIEALGKIKELSAAEMQLQLKAGKAIGKTGDGLKAISEKYTKIIEEAELMLATKGVVAKSGGELFVQVKTGTLLFEDGKLTNVKDILEAFYKEIGGTVEFKNGIFYGRSGSETTLFVPESKAIEMSLPNLLEPRRQALEIVGEFDTALPEMEKFKSFSEMKTRIEKLAKDFEGAKSFINAEPSNALTKLSELKTKMTELKTAGEKIEDAKVVAGTNPNTYTYRWAGTTKLDDGLKLLGARRTKGAGASAGLKSVIAELSDGSTLVFTERAMPASYSGKEIIIDPANADVQKLFTEFSVTDPAARREIMRRLEVSMSSNKENLSRSLTEAKSYLTDLQTKSSTLGSVEKQLLEIATKGRVATETAVTNPKIITIAADLEAQGILKSRQFLDHRTPQEFEGTVAEYLAQKDIAATSTAAGKTVYRNVHIIGDMFADPAGTKPYVRSSGGGSTNIDVVSEIDTISGMTSKSGFELTDIYNVKAGKGAAAAKKQNDNAEIALRSFENNSIVEITNNEGKIAYIKVKTINAMDATGNVVDLTSQLKLSSSGVSKITYGAPGRSGFDKNILATSSEITDIAKVLRERLLMNTPTY